MSGPFPPREDGGGSMNYDLSGQSSDAVTKQPKVFFAGDQYDGQTVLAIQEDDISIFSNRTEGIAVSEKFGTLLTGRLQFAAMPHQMSFAGGYWKLDPRHLATLPSTTPTPIPLFVKSEPDLFSAQKVISKAIDTLMGFSDIKL
jgi:hypothetical protein